MAQPTCDDRQRGVPAGPMERNPHRLGQGAVGRTQQVLDHPVIGVLSPLHQLQRGSIDLAVHSLPHPAGEPLELEVVVVVGQHVRHQPPGLTQRDLRAPVGQRGHELARCHA